jgi:hypothetical protein
MTTELEVRPVTPMELLNLALTNNAAIDVIERLAALQDKERARHDEIEFNDALNRIQEKIRRIAPDMVGQKNNKYASYVAIDRVIRPIYAAEGMSLSFSHAECQKPDHIRVICRVALRGYKELYQVDWPVDTKGPKGEPIMTLTQATGVSDSYAKRYLVKDIFNISIGELDTDGDSGSNGELQAHIDELANAIDLDALKSSYKSAYAKYEAHPAALKTIIAAKNARRKELDANN